MTQPPRPESSENQLVLRKPIAVCVLRMSAIGDVVITARALHKLKSAGCEPILVTAPALADVPRCFPSLRFFILVEGKEIKFFEKSEEFPLGRELPWDEWPSFSSWHLLDLQRTKRSQRAHSQLKHLMQSRKKGEHFASHTKVSKQTIRRMWLIFLARLCAFFFGQTQRSKGPLYYLHRKSILKTIHVLQGEAVEKVLKKAVRKQLHTPSHPSGTISSHQSEFLRFPEALASQQNLPSPLCHFALHETVLLVPGASGFVKQWPKESFRKLAQQLQWQGVKHVVILGGPLEKHTGRYVAHGLPESFLFDATGQLSLAQSFFLISKARHVFTSDTFASHVADLCQIPTTVFFGATSPFFGFVPLSLETQILYANIQCSPCTRHGLSGCRYSNLKCQRLLTPESALTHLK
jgi:heptosyltransferase II